MLDREGGRLLGKEDGRGEYLQGWWFGGGREG